jgi:hypothetical protein
MTFTFNARPCLCTLADTVMNIGKISTKGTTAAAANRCAEAPSSAYATARVVPVGFYDHWTRYMAPRLPSDRQALIAAAAYFRAESRGFAAGHELDDWLAAEEEIDQRLAGEGRAY